MSVNTAPGADKVILPLSTRLHLRDALCSRQDKDEEKPLLSESQRLYLAERAAACLSLSYEKVWQATTEQCTAWESDMAALFKSNGCQPAKPATPTKATTGGSGDQ